MRHDCWHSINNEVYEETVPNTLNLLKLYKDNPEIQENGYKLLSLFAKNPTFAQNMVNNGLLDVVKETIENPLFNDSLKEKAKGIKNAIYAINYAKQEVNIAIIVQAA